MKYVFTLIILIAVYFAYPKAPEKKFSVKHTGNKIVFTGRNVTAAELQRRINATLLYQKRQAERGTSKSKAFVK